MGKVLIGGDFALANSVNYIARFNRDGSLDTGFNRTGASARSAVNSIAVQADGKLLVATRFTIVRLSPDGSLDQSFNGAVGAGGEIRSVSAQANGKALIGGEFTSVNGVARTE